MGLLLVNDKADNAGNHSEHNNGTDSDSDDGANREASLSSHWLRGRLNDFSANLAARVNSDGAHRAEEVRVLVTVKGHRLCALSKSQGLGLHRGRLLTLDQFVAGAGGKLDLPGIVGIIPGGNFTDVLAIGVVEYERRACDASATDIAVILHVWGHGGS